MDDDGNGDFFLELADLDEPVTSFDSSKKRKIEEGGEFSSPFFPKVINDWWQGVIFLGWVLLGPYTVYDV